MRQSRTIILTFLCLSSSVLPAHAARDASNAMITEMTLGSTNGDVLFIRVDPAPTGSTGCHQNSHWHYTLPLGNPLGKNMYALLLSMQAQGRPMAFAGLDACNDYTSAGGSVETLRAIGVVF